MTPQLIREHGLTDEEYGRIRTLLGRDANLVELGVFSVMWSEHCSYKSTRALGILWREALGHLDLDDQIDVTAAPETPHAP